MRRWMWWIAIPVGLIAIAVLALLVVNRVSVTETENTQAALDPFYTPPSPLTEPVGTVLRTEPLGVEVPGATALRMLYVSERPDGTLAASGGMVFIPDGPAPPSGRPVVAWAHGTLGMGDACAPSRSADPLSDTTYWLDQMLSLGWVVTATDYVGLGTPGPELYLVGEAEARDVVNSVRAVRNLPDAAAGQRYVVWGHSQGGHSALWTGHLSDTLAPELDLLAVAAAAPAAQLADIMGAQWDDLVGWGIGPEVLVSWPVVYPELSPDQVASPAGLENYERLADECLKQKSLMVELLARQQLGERFFAGNPVDVADWRAKADAQTPPPLPAELPVLVAQSMADEVVLAWPNAVTQTLWCEAGSTIEMLWLGVVNHQQTAMTAGPTVVAWIDDRFADRPARRTCDLPPPVAPEAPVAPAAS